MADKRAEKLYCFLDANIFIHYQTFTEVKWDEKLKAKHVELILTPSVSKNLENFKYDSTNEGRKKRVRKILPLLDKLLDDAEPGKPVKVRNNVNISEIYKMPSSINWSELGLSQQHDDDVFLASILEFTAQHPMEQVVLVTGDGGFGRKAKGYGIKVVRPTGLIDEAEKEPVESGKNFQVQTGAPDLNFGFWENEAITATVTREIEPKWVGSQRAEQDIRDFVEAYKDKLHEMLEYMRYQGELNERNIGNFKKKYEERLPELERGLTVQGALKYGYKCELEFVLKNEGSSPATDVQVELHFPKDFYIVEESDYEPPNTALWAEYGGGSIAARRFSIDAHSIPKLYRKVDQLQSVHGPGKPTYDTYKNNTIFYKSDKVTHQYVWHLEPLIIFVPQELSKGFQIPYVVRGDELKKPIQNQLNVVFKMMLE